MILRNNAEKARGCVSISNLFVCIDLLLLTIKNDADVRKIGLEDVHQHETYLFVMAIYE